MQPIINLEKIKNIAKQRGGTCLSNTYYNRQTKMLFECKLKHQWETTWSIINKGSWCPECAKINSRGLNNHRSDCYENMIKIATDRQGKCLSLEYLGAHHKLEWQCSLGHTWFAKPCAIKNSGTWCPQCSIGVGERVCRLIFETIFKESFIKIRPDWLKNNLTGKNLELDGYCEKLNIAFEYNGEQHYSDNTIYTRSKYDLHKIETCKNNGLRLFIIKEISNITKYQNIIEEIKSQARDFNIVADWNINIPIFEIYKTNMSTCYLNEIKKIAQLHGGACLSSVYFDSVLKLDFKCNKCNFIWKASPNAIKNGTWCPNCANKIRSIDNAIELANNKNGKCLSLIYKNSIEKMKWQCNLDHIWDASYNQIQSGDWCPTCFRANRGKAKKIGLEAYKKAALDKGGECLSNYVNSCYEKLEWKCAKGHVWFSQASAIKNTKQWCPECAINKKKNI